ncbi:MAG: hypothetical protein ABI396_02220, partial [Ktedonobacteraceae bacterium]
AALLWNTIYSLVGYFIAVEIDLLQVFFERAGWLMLGGLVVLFLAWQLWKRHGRRRRKQARRVKQTRVLQGEK